MAKKNQSIQMWIIIGLIIIVIFGVSSGWFKSTLTTINQETINQLDTSPQQTGVECKISFSKSTLNPGESVTGTITNGKNTQCAIYYQYNNGPWTFDSIVTTDSSGKYTETRTAGNGGTYVFAVICGNCITNQAILVVRGVTTTTTIPIDYSSYTCGRTEDCVGTCPSTHPLCNKAQISSNTWTCSCQDASGTVHPEWSFVGTNYNVYEGEEQPACTDYDNTLTNFENSLTIQNICVDSSGSHEDSCDNGLLKEWYCSSQGDCIHTFYGCKSYFGDNAYCRSGWCFDDPYINPSNCEVSGMWQWSYLIDTEENCGDAMVNLCYYSGQLSGAYTHNSETDCCYFRCVSN